MAWTWSRCFVKHLATLARMPESTDLPIANSLGQECVGICQWLIVKTKCEMRSNFILWGTAFIATPTRITWLWLMVCANAESKRWTRFTISQWESKVWDICDIRLFSCITKLFTRASLLCLNLCPQWVRIWMHRVDLRVTVPFGRKWHIFLLLPFKMRK